MSVSQWLPNGRFEFPNVDKAKRKASYQNENGEATTTMTDNNSSSDNPFAAVPRRKRRRKRRKSSAQRIGSSDSNNNNNDANLSDDNVGWRHHKTTATTSSTNCDALDAELENQVNKLIVQSNRQNKKRRAIANDDTTTCTDKELVVNTKSPIDMSTSLPTLLHIREVGLSSRLGRHRTQIPFVANVDSLDDNGNNASWMTLLLHQPAYSRRQERKDNQQSDGVLDTSAINNNDYDDDHSNSTRRLRVPVQNRHALQHDDEDNYNKGSKSKDASTILYRRKTWRPYTQQTIQFSKLNTPHSVAILAMDQWGGYSIGVAGVGSCGVGRGDPSLRRPSLSLQFYGVPSPARLLSSDQPSTLSTSIISPLVHSIPLLLNNNQYNSSGSEEAPVQISDTPIQILLCSNGAFGVGYVLDSRATAPLRSDIFSRSPALQDDFMGTVVIFETPRDGAAITKSFHCCNVRIGGWKSFTMRNALWPAMYVPSKQNTEGCVAHQFSSLMFDINVSSAHMLFNDEDDGFRITWIQPFKEKVNDYATTAKRIPLPLRKIQANRDDIVTVSDEHETWEACLSDPRTGLVHQSDNDNSIPPRVDKEISPQLDIIYEVYLHIDALLIDIITRRQQSSSMFQMSKYHSDTVRFIPNFYYNLISVSGDGLDITLVIVFSNKEKMIMQSSQSSSNNNNKKLPAALGVVIKFSIFNQSYDELKWVQHPSCEDDSSMKQWCNSLALNWRMKECGVGVFCLEHTMKNDTWVGKTHERNVDDDLEDDYNGNLWSKYYVEKEEAKVAKNRVAVAPPKDISMSSLYPHCDVITNRAVYDAIPVKKISSRKSPAELIYG